MDSGGGSVHQGHRLRLRRRFLDEGMRAFADHEVLEFFRGVKAERPDHIWGIDITYIRMKGSFMCLVAIIDWYSRHAGVPGKVGCLPRKRSQP